MIKEYKIVLGVVKFKNKFLIGKRAITKKFAPGKWEFISGFIEEDEKPEQTILRELQEETNLHGRIIKSGETYNFKDKEGNWLVFPYLIGVKNDNFDINKDDHSELKWINLNDLLKYVDISEDIRKLKKMRLLE